MLAPSETVQHLQAARNLIADPAKWCQFETEDNGRYCAVGADLWSRGEPLYGASGQTRFYSVSPHLVRAADELFDRYVETVNDELGHEAVMRMFDRAIELASAGE